MGKTYNLKYTTAEEAVKIVKSGDRLHWPCVAAAPELLIQALVARAPELQNTTTFGGMIVIILADNISDPRQFLFPFFIRA